MRKASTKTSALWDEGHEDSLENIIDKFKPYLGELRNCIICNSKKFESWAQLKYLEAKKCLNCGMISVNPHINEEGQAMLYSNYFEQRDKMEDLSRLRELMYNVDINWIHKFIQGGSVLDVGCSGGYFLNKFDSSGFS